MGYPAKEPANTVASARAAVAAGADMVEIDVSMTADRHPVAIHGPKLDHTTNGSGRVDRSTLDHVKALEIKRRGEVVPGMSVPLVIEIVEDLDGVAFNFDLKTGRAMAPVLAMIEAEGLADRCVVSGATAWRLGRVRRAAPDVTVLLNLNRLDKVLARTRFGAWWLTTRYRRLLRKPEVAALNINHNWVTPALVRRVHALGAELWAYTVDDADRAVALVELGVDSITTNRVGEIDLPTG
jgi:glycerophosphoryl diester phosphodiesterase